MALEAIAKMMAEQQRINLKVALALEHNAKANDTLAKQMTGLRASIQGAQRVIRGQLDANAVRSLEHDRIAAETRAALHGGGPVPGPSDG